MNNIINNTDIRFEWLYPDAAEPNPLNWRRHPASQMNAIEDLIFSQKGVGWAGVVLVNDRQVEDGWNAEEAVPTLIDGHARQKVALERNEPMLTMIRSWSPDDERKILATLDPISAMAEVDEAALDALMEHLQGVSQAVDAMVAEMAQEVQIGGDGTFSDRSAVLPEEQYPRNTLMERFGVPPFSVLSARQGYWQERKRAWLSLGLASYKGRESLETTGSAVGGVPRYYSKKAACEKMLGRELSHKEFQDEYIDRYMAQSSLEITETGGIISIFDPVLAELMYTWFCPPGGWVLDPFAGGSVRGIVASMTGRHYTGIDLSTEQVEANQEQATQILPVSLGEVADTLSIPELPPEWLIGDSQAMDSLLPTDRSFDFVFSCPPYHNLEVYTDDPNDLSNMDYDNFIVAYRRIISKPVARLRNDRFACFVVGDIRDKRGMYRNFVSDTIQAFHDAGVQLYNEAILVTQVGSLPVRAGRLFSTSRKLGKAHQNVLIFIKGDPKLATTACGQVEVIGALDHSIDSENPALSI